jgi:outer membrane protein OmpA-like peptidoglycan-associated protein
VALVGLTACATGNKLKADAEVIRAEIGKARRSGAYNCAPRELALAESNLEFGELELDQGDSSRAQDHLTVAGENVKKAMVMSRECGPKTVTIKEPVVIQKLDKDGDGITDNEDQCPDVPGVPEHKGCPKDTDQDGVRDDLDRCPLDPEDKDGFQDEDGCPDPDNDQDGVVDKVDECPIDPGPIENKGCPDADKDNDGISDRNDKCPEDPGMPPDGCPKKYTLVEVKKDKIEIKQQVKFSTAKFKVLPASHGLLNQVVQVLNDYPKMKIRVEGHTDSVGGETKNLKLSQKRADAVKDYLVGKGIDAARLEAVGFGLTKPIASNKTKKGRAQNRRTEFHIVSME